MTNKTVMVPVELLEAAIEYMECTHNNIDHFKTILKAAPKIKGEPVGYLDLSRTKITDNPHFTVGPVTNHPGWFPVYAAPQQAKAEWMPIESAPKNRTIWLGNKSSIRIGTWREGKEYEHKGSVGGGWQDFKTERDLHFTPTHWQNLPQPPEKPE